MCTLYTPKCNTHMNGWPVKRCAKAERIYFIGMLWS